MFGISCNLSAARKLPAWVFFSSFRALLHINLNIIMIIFIVKSAALVSSDGSCHMLRLDLPKCPGQTSNPFLPSKRISYWVIFTTKVTTGSRAVKANEPKNFKPTDQLTRFNNILWLTFVRQIKWTLLFCYYFFFFFFLEEDLQPEEEHMVKSSFLPASLDHWVTVTVVVFGLSPALRKL